MINVAVMWLAATATPDGVTISTAQVDGAIIVRVSDTMTATTTATIASNVPSECWVARYEGPDEDDLPPRRSRPQVGPPAAAPMPRTPPRASRRLLHRRAHC